MVVPSIDSSSRKARIYKWITRTCGERERGILKEKMEIGGEKRKLQQATNAIAQRKRGRIQLSAGRSVQPLSRPSFVESGLLSDRGNQTGGWRKKTKMTVKKARCDPKPTK